MAPCTHEFKRPGRRSCIACGVKIDQRQRDVRVARREKGLCISCGKRPFAVTSRCRCEPCKAKNAEAHARWKKGNLERLAAQALGQAPPRAETNIMPGLRTRMRAATSARQDQEARCNEYWARIEREAADAKKKARAVRRN